MPGLPQTPLIDCRNFNDYCAGHIKGATSLPADQLFIRMHELAQRHIPLTLCGDNITLAAARDFFIDRQFTINSEILWSPELETLLEQQQNLECGASSVRLWQPAPLLSDFIENILPLYPATSKNGLDIACGAGRDMVYLAMQGWQMLGLDNSAEALQRSQQLAEYNHVTINTIQTDLEKTENPFAGITEMRANSLDLICGFRYLHRPLFPYLQRLLKPGGLIIYQTFMEGCENISSPRNPRFLLKPNELVTIFPNFDIIRNEVIQLEDGRPMSAFIARKIQQSVY